MSLIADALKAAQQEKQVRTAAPQQPRAQSYLALRATHRNKAPVNKSVFIGAGALAGVLLIGSIVAITMLKSPGAPEVRDIPTKIVQPPPEPTQVASVDTVLVDSTAVMTPASVADEAGYAERTPGAAFRSNAPTKVPATVAAANSEDENGSEDEPVAPPTPPTPPPRVKSRVGSTPLTITLEPPKTGTRSDSFQRASAAHKRGDLSTAKQLYLEALSANPKNPEVFNNLGEVYRLSNELAQAEDAFRDAIRISPNFGPAWSNLGVVLIQLGKKQEAMSALQNAIKLEPTNAGTRANLAVQYYNANLFADAKRLLEEAINLNPGLAEAHYNLGRTLEAMGDKIGAIKSYNTFLSVVGGNFPGVQEQVRKHAAELERNISR